MIVFAFTRGLLAFWIINQGWEGWGKDIVWGAFVESPAATASREHV